MSGNLSVHAFEADGAFVFMTKYYNFGEGYIFSNGTVYEIAEDYSNPTLGNLNGDSLSLYKGTDGKIHYRKIAGDVTPAQQSDFIFLTYVTSRDQYYGEEGTVTLDDGELVFSRTELKTVSDYFESNGRTIDEWFENLDKSDFDKIFTGVDNPASMTLDDLFEYNKNNKIE